MSERGRSLLDPLMPHFVALGPDDLFEFVVERTASSLFELAEDG